MDVYVRLYWQHDLDLIALHYSPSVPKVGYLMKEALSAHVRHTPYEIYVPEKIMFRKPIKSCNANIKLYEGKDDDLIEYVKSLHYGLRSNAMKQILRNYLSHMFILPYAQGSGIYFQSKIHTNKQKNATITNKKALQIEKEEQTTQEKPKIKQIEEKEITSIKEKPESHHEEEKKSEKTVPPIEEQDEKESNDDFDLFGAIESMM